MIKTSAMFSAHAIHVLIRNTLIFFIVLFIALFAWLSVGIEIDTFKASGYRIDGLYIKLDKKLTLKAKKVIIPKRKANPSFDRIDQTLERIKYVLTFFEHIDLKKIIFENNILGIYFYDNILQLSSKEYLIRGNVHREGKMLIGDIPILQLKESNITMKGMFSYNLHEDILRIRGTFALHHCIGEFNVSKVQNDIRISLKSKPFGNIKPVIDLFDVIPAVRTWVVDRVKAKTYQLLSFTGGGKIIDNTFYPDMDRLKGKVLFKDVHIDFKEGLDAVKAEKMLLEYSHKKGLVFKLKSPVYKDKNLHGSSVCIRGLEGNHTRLVVDLKLYTPFDKTVKNLLKAYDVTIPLNQTAGDLNGTLHIEKGLNDAYFDLHGSVTLHRSEMILNNVPLHVLSGTVHYDTQRVRLLNVFVKDKMYEGVVDGTVMLKKHRANLVFDAKQIFLRGKKKKIFSIKNVSLPFLIAYQKNLHIEIPKLSLSLDKRKDKSIIRITDLRKIKPYMQNSTWFANGGKVTLKTKDFKQFTIHGTVKPQSCFVYENQEKCKTDIPFDARLSEYLSFNAFGKRIAYNQRKNRIKIDHLNIDLKRLLDAGISDNIYKNTRSMTVLGTQSYLKYDSHSLLLEHYKVKILPHGEIEATGSCAGGRIAFSKKQDYLSIKAFRLKDKAMHSLLHFDALSHGRYTVTLSGEPKKTMQGEMIIEGGIIRNSKNDSHRVSTSPQDSSLNTVSRPVLSKKGFKIRRGVLKYHVVEHKRLVFDTIDIRGDSAKIVGKGFIDLTRHTIDIDLQVQVARDIGKVLGSLPLVGYILMGKEKCITVGLKISGTLDKPLVRSSVVTDILSSPFGLIKRTLESPAHIINQSK